MNGDEKTPITDYRDLDVWKESMTLAAEIYQLTRAFPRDEQFGLTSQLRRASVSVATNIAEGYGRQQTKPFIQFLRISQGSLKEVETLLMLSERVGATASQAVESAFDRCQRIGRMLGGLIRKREEKEVRR